MAPKRAVRKSVPQSLIMRRKVQKEVESESEEEMTHEQATTTQQTQSQVTTNAYYSRLSKITESICLDRVEIW